MSGDYSERLAAIMIEVKALASEYYALTGKPLGVTGEVAEHSAATLLDLQLVPPRTEGYDAIRTMDGASEKIQIKGRAISRPMKPGQRIGTIKIDADCDSVMLVLLEAATLDVIEIWEASMADVRSLLTATESKSRARGSLAITTFRTKARKVWPAEAEV